MAWLEIRTSLTHSVVQSTNHWATEHVGIVHCTPKLSANAPLLCAQVYDRRKRNFCKMSANVIAPLIYV